MAETMVSTSIRSPLSETAGRINATYRAQDGHYKPPYVQSAIHNTSDAVHANYAAYAANRAPRSYHQPARPVTHTAAATLQPPQEVDDRRLSQASYDSSSSSRSKKNYKTHIGPWQLGKTLGKGSSARVRLCRHNITGQMAAVKIVNRRMAYLVQDSSLAALSKWDSSLPDQADGEMRVPMAIEREVAILKLIEHPNIMKLYDIWENRSEV